MAEPRGFDVLVLGSGASGLAAAVSAERAGARVALATKGSIQSCNSAKAQGGIQAAVGPDDSPEASPVVLAGGGRCFAVAEERGELSTNHPGATGEVTQIALDAGAQARDLDALQYHPNGGAWPESMQGYSIPETTRAYGAVLLNADGEEFTDSLGPRDVVSQAIVDEVAKGKGVETADGRPAVYLDTTRIAAHDAQLSLPYMLRRYRAAGIDPLTEKILPYPVLHYQNGGLVIDRDAETTLEGVFACGEIAGGTHGRNRMMGNSLLECVVFGRRAGKAAAEKARA